MAALLLVIFSSIATFTRNIDSYPLRNWDEAWYAEMIKNMASGQYSLLQVFWNGKYYFDNAPLYFWLTVPIFKFFGPGEWQTRLVSSTAAISSCILIFLIGKKLAGTAAGLISFLVLLTLGGVTIRFSHGNLDSLLTSFLLAAFYTYLLSEKQRIFSFVCGAIIGLGFLIKSWGVGLFPLALIFIYSFTKEKKLPKHLHLITPGIIIFSFWFYILGALKIGQSFINWYIFNPTVSKLSTPLSDFSLSYFYFVLRDIGFWFVIPLAYLVLCLKDIAKINKSIVIPLASLSILFITVLNFLKDKSDWYLIPSLALIALLIGYLGQLLYEKRSTLAICLISLVFLVQIVNVIRIENIYPDRSKVGADLGMLAKKIIPNGSTVILEDADFTSFLYYSDQKAIFTLQKDGPKPGEWWILTKNDLPSFSATHQDIWVVSKNPSQLNLNFNPQQIQNSLDGYSFIKL